MRPGHVAALLCLVVGPAAAQQPGRPAADESVPACDSLIDLRRLAAAAGDNREKAVAEIASQPGCRLVSRKAIGTTERRAVVGGAPYECLTQPSGPCLWVLP